MTSRFITGHRFNDATATSSFMIPLTRVKARNLELLNPELIVADVSFSIPQNSPLVFFFPMQTSLTCEM